MGKDMEGSGRGLIKATILAFSWRYKGNPRKHSVRIAGSLDRNLNPGPPEYESVTHSVATCGSISLGCLIIINTIKWWGMSEDRKSLSVLNNGRVTVTVALAVTLFASVLLFSVCLCWRLHRMFSCS
jgi:hypothetical protein